MFTSIFLDHFLCCNKTCNNQAVAKKNEKWNDFYAFISEFKPCTNPGYLNPALNNSAQKTRACTDKTGLSSMKLVWLIQIAGNRQIRGIWRCRQSRFPFPTYLGMIEATLLAGYAFLHSLKNIVLVTLSRERPCPVGHSLCTAAPAPKKMSLPEEVSVLRLVGPKKKEKGGYINWLSLLLEQPLTAETTCNW